MAGRADERPLPRWKSWSRLWAWVFSALLVILLIGSVVVPALAPAFLALPGVLAIGFGTVQAVAPERFLEWREADTAPNGFGREVLEGSDELLGIRKGDDQRFDDRSVRRVRIVGIAILLFGIAAAVGPVFAHEAGLLDPRR